MAASTAPRRALTVLPLMAATYCMVAGGPFGLEDIVGDAGYLGAIVILLITPVIWSLPTALMVSELSSALPEDGGYYAWVRRGLGRFWGFQEAWLSLAASVFDMAIYPTLFTLYLGRLAPELVAGNGAFLIGLAVIGACALWNIRGAKAVGASSIWMTAAMLSPFVLLSIFAVFIGGHAQTTPAPVAHCGLLGGILVGMWNYMGWDNASTVAGEVERPQRTYPLAMLGALALVALTYVVPVLAASFSGIGPEGWTAGGWADIGGAVGGKWLMIVIVVCGMISAFSMFNALTLSYSRVPAAMAEDGLLPKVFARRTKKSDAPWVAILVCAVGWGACLKIGFERLVAIDILLYGLSLSLEFVALVALRIREPNLARPFRVPGGLPGAVVAGLLPTGLIVLAAFHNRDEQMFGINALLFGAIVAAIGPVLYVLRRRFR